MEVLYSARINDVEIVHSPAGIEQSTVGETDDIARATGAVCGVRATDGTKPSRETGVVEAT